MKAYLGIDGGGSKTLFALADEEGRLLSVWRAGSASYKQIGTEGLLELVKTGRKQVLLLAKEKLGEEIFLESCCLGMPMYGESEEMDRKIEEQFKQHFPQDKLLLVNDAVAGWAGALLLQPGINVVAGTGSIAYGRNEQGQEGGKAEAVRERRLSGYLLRWYFSGGRSGDETLSTKAGGGRNGVCKEAGRASSGSHSAGLYIQS